MEEKIKLVGYGVDTLFLQELDEKLVQALGYLQGEARRLEIAVATDWAFLDVLLFVEPHEAGK